jgi:hypothetical protein
VASFFVFAPQAENQPLKGGKNMKKQNLKWLALLLVICLTAIFSCADNSGSIEGEYLGNSVITIEGSKQEMSEGEVRVIVTSYEDDEDDDNEDVYLVDILLPQTTISGEFRKSGKSTLRSVESLNYAVNLVTNSTVLNPPALDDEDDTDNDSSLLVERQCIIKLLGKLNIYSDNSRGRATFEGRNNECGITTSLTISNLKKVNGEKESHDFF